MRAGAAKPNIGTADAFKAALIGAQSIATVPASAAGAQVMKAIERVGLGDAIKGKLQAKAAPGEIIQAVAQGEAELGLFLLNVLTAPGLDLAGPFPADLQQEIVYTAAPALETKQAERREGADRLPQVTGSDRDHQGEGHDAELRRGAGILA